MILCGFSLKGLAQEFGGNPPSVRWMQMDTDSLRVLFPRGTEKEALQVLNTASYMNQNERASIGNGYEKLNIILQPGTVISNGFVARGPFRAVFQTTPPADNFSLGTTNWLSELSIHETWHALQNMNFRAGLGRTFNTLFGGAGQGMVTHLLIPDWYWEGDAVFMETRLTDQGRGRLPSLMAPFKSLSLAQKDYTYAKIRNGSLRDLVPNEYELGYMMVAYGRDHYGYNFWRPVLQQTLLNRQFIKPQNQQHPDRPFKLFHYGFYPMNAALNYHTGKKIPAFYRAALAHFSQSWATREDSLQPIPADTLRAAGGKTVFNYRYPTLTPDGRLLVLTSGYAQNPEVVALAPDGSSKRLARLGTSLQPYYSYGGNKIVWAEYRPDIRWGWRSYSVICVKDLSTGRTTQLSNKSKYFTPALSPDGHRIVATATAAGTSNQLVLLDAESGQPLQRLPAPEGQFYTYPVFGPGGNQIVAGLRDSLSNMALVAINLQTGALQRLTPFAPKAMGPARVTRTMIYFPAAYGTEIQLFALRKKDGRIFRITRRSQGNYSLAVDTAGHRIIFDEYSAGGFQLLEKPLDSSRWQAVSVAGLKKVHNPYVPQALQYNNNGSILSKIPRYRYPVRRYYPLKHLFRVHSWAFTSLYPEVSLFLQSRDLMGTLEAAAGGGYNLNEHTPFADAHFRYGGLFPFLSAGLRETFNRSGYVQGNQWAHWNELNWSAGFQVPLNLSGSLYQRQLSLSGDYHHSTLSFKEKKIRPDQDNRSVSYYTARLSFNNLRNPTVQDLNPKFGTSLSLEYNHTLGMEDASQLIARLNVFLPGFFVNHSLYFTSAYSDKENSNHYKFSDNYPYALGYNSVPYAQIYTLGANYQLPLAYPDWGLTWAYLLRIRLHGFFNYSEARLIPGLAVSRDTYRSTGLSMFFDLRLFNTLDVPVGIRYTRLLDKDLADPDKRFKWSVSFPLKVF